MTLTAVAGQVQIKNFGCFENANFDFNLPNGLYLITGRNEQLPELGSNGVGKSTLLSALMWVLYGKGVNGAKAGKLLNRAQGKGYSASIGIKDKTIFRSWSPNKLTIDDKEVSQAEVDALIGLTAEQFTQVVLFGQSQPGFIDLTATEKLDFLSQIFNLNRWLTLSGYCKEQVSNLSRELSLKNVQKDSIQSECENISIQLGELEGRIDEWNKAKDQDKRECESRLEAAREKIPQPINRSEVEALFKEYSQEVAEAAGLLDGAREAERAARTEIQIQERDNLRFRNDIERLTKSADQPCPTCNQPIDNSNIKVIIAALKEKLQEPTAELEENLVKAKELVGLATAEHDRLQGLFESVKEMKRDLDNQEKNREFALREVQVQEDQLDRINRSINPHLATKESMEKRALDLLEKIDAVAEAAKKLDKKVAEYSFWQKQFPEIRLMILDEVINELEIHFNASFAMLGLGDWHISVFTERELKNETVKRELNIKIVQNGEEIDLDSLSGGERQRCRLAVSLGISDLIKSRLGLKFDLLLLDEPCQALSQSGIQGLLVLLAEMAQHRPILIAEHRLLELHNFAGIYTIVKGTDGNSRIENG